MLVSINTRQNRKYESWLVRIRVGDRWYEVANVLHPAFWLHWWSMWQGKRAWALRWWMRHLGRRIEPSIYAVE